MSSAPASSTAVPALRVTLWRDAVAAGVVTLAALSFYLSVASLLFQGALQPHLPAAIGAVLLGGAVLSAVGAWRGSLSLASMGAQPTTVPVLAAMTAQIAAAVSGPGLLPTAVVTLALTAVLIGSGWWLIGQRRWGNLIRFIPYPVIGGFLAASGWLMFSGGLGVSMGHDLRLQTLQTLAAGTLDLHLIVGLLAGVLIWHIALRWPQPLVLPALLLGVGLLIHLGLRRAGLDLAAAQAQGWLLAPFHQAWPVWPLQPALLAAVHWDVVAQQLPLMVSALIVATLSLLLSGTSLEVAWDERADINRDLVALGQGNVLAAALGGLTGGISVSRSALNRAVGGTGRASGALSALLVVAALLWGGPLIGWVPRPLLGAMLVCLGLDTLKAWLLDSRPRLSRWEHATVVGMVAATALVGFLTAVCLGLLVCCLGFVVASSRLPPVRRLLTRQAWPSRVERPGAQGEWLQGQGQGLLLVELQGVLFFGSATRLGAEIEARLAVPQPPRCLLFDFRHVRGLDTSAAQALVRLFKTARMQGVVVELSHLSARAQATLQSAAGGSAALPPCHADIDRAVAAWDDAQLAAGGPPAGNFEAGLRALLPSGVSPEELLAHFEAVSLQPGQTLFRRGDAADALYLVRSGRLSAWVPGTQAEVVVRTVMAGSAIGEMGLFRRIPRSATLRAEEASSLLRLSEAALQQMDAQQPALAAALYRLFVLQMASRVDQLTAQSQALAR